MTPRAAPARPFFLPVDAAAGAHAIFCLHHVPVGTARGAVLYVPPFAEEMNKSRRMAALQARAFAAAGWHVLQIDLFGCGDSEGDSADASWAAWRADIAAARAWLAAEAGHPPWLWGLRLGGLLAAASLALEPAGAAGLLLWQPVLSGRQHLQQFLRLQAGAQWVSGEQKAQVEADTSAQPLDRLKAGATVEVAGYTLAPALALPLAEAELRLPAAPLPVAWFEVSPRDGATLAPASERLLAAAGREVHHAVLQGPSFWAATEIETAPALLAASGAALSS